MDLELYNANGYKKAAAGGSVNPGQFLHDHARPAWSATVVRTTSFTCPSNIGMLFFEAVISHANVTAIWDMHLYVGTTSGGSDLLNLGGNTGWVGVSSGTGTPYPLCGAYCIPVTPNMWGTTIYVTSSAPAGNYYLSGSIWMFCQ